ncbi:hypothetical protein KV097_03485 [Mumia sp. zg.B17]|uniref:peroxidase family protein n=1 Tax=Mumia sp. zg.B17 TaxID=2855446 RepID=UPI001C6E578A|nr:heme peroxidase family protein [Mumia sp. zg.B17]MBW9204992.1 hypothetical protein [Mumia sp. zg.B17]
MATTTGHETTSAEERPPTPAPEPTTPTRPVHHGASQRGIDMIPSSSFKSGRFGRMFRHLPVFEHAADDMTALAQRMVEPAGPPAAENPDIPSGYTYFGQFVDHDITFDPVSSLRRQNDPDALHNFRTPRFDLDSLYGRGPADQPYLYDDSGPVTKMRLGEDVGVVPTETSGAGPDLPRNEPRQRTSGEEVFFGRALIGDPRNDENLLVSQLHVSMLQFHNRVADVVGATTPLTGDDAFKETQRLVRWHYQWVVVHDFLRRIVGQAVVDDILRTETFVSGRDGATTSLVRPTFQFYEPAHEAYIPVEFAVAAYRFGHSMIRGRYHINDFVRNARGAQGPIPIFGTELPPDELSNLNGFRRLPPQWAVEWKFMVDMPGSDTPAQASLPIDTQLARPLADLPLSVSAHPPHALAERNLQRGVALGLPAGNTVARAMGVDPLDAATLGIGDLSEDLRMHPPLWFYILKEAETLADGKTLGPVGGRIVAEVLIGLLNEDPLSYLSVEPNWRPQAPMARDDGSFDLPQLLRFAKEG